jgi:hypothetical protein
MAFSFSSSEDVSVQKFLSVGTLAENFNLPLSPEALHEVRDIQRNVAHILLQFDVGDKWRYEWGSDKYSSSLFYKYCFR